MMDEIYYIKAIKNYINIQDKIEQPRLKTFFSEYEKKRADYFQNEILYKFMNKFMGKNITFVGSGLPYYIFNIFEKIYENPIGFVEYTTVDENNLHEVFFDSNYLKGSYLNFGVNDQKININLIDYSPLIKKHYKILNDIYKNLNFIHYDNNVIFEDVKEITKDSVIIIPYSEYLYLINELDIFNKDQTVVVFNQIDDDEKRKLNVVFCIEDLLEQTPLTEVFLSEENEVNVSTSYNIVKEPVNQYCLFGKT